MHDPVGTSRVVIVDDHALLAQSLVLALDAADLPAVRIEPTGSDEIVAAVRDLGCELVLLDLNLGDQLGSSVALIPRLREAGACVAMLTGTRDRVRLAECVEAGACGIVGKHQPFDELVDATRRALHDGGLLTLHEREELLGELRRQRRDEQGRLESFRRLTPREGDVLAGLMEGLTADQLAERAVLSVATVRSQIRAVLLKLGVNSQLAAVSKARRAGWEPPQSRR